MSNRLYPTEAQLQQLPNPLTEGEWALVRYLDKYLPVDSDWTEIQSLRSYRGWLIFVQPYFNGSRPDVVILHPAVGIVIYEVKDWDLSLYSWHNNSLFVRTRTGSQRIASPIKQVKAYRDKFISQLVPQIGEQIDHKAYVTTLELIKPALYFHNGSQSQARQIFETKHELILGHDSLRPENLHQVVPTVHLTNSGNWRSAWNEEIIFWLKPPYHSIEQGEKLSLRGNQAKVAEPSTGHHRIRGVAGSGKTLALAYRAAKLASQGFDVLIITFNITLWHYIRDMIKRAPFGFSMERIEFNHFHGFCKDRLLELGAEWPSSHNHDRQTFFQSVVPLAVANAITNPVAGIDPQKRPQYDAILIDEGQDYHYEWYEMLDKYFLRSRDELVVVCDKKQNIYEREMLWLDKRVTRTGLDKFKDGYIDLTMSYRLPPTIADISNNFSEVFKMNQDLRGVKQTDQLALFTTEHLVWVNISPEQWLEYLYYAFCRLKKAECQPSDMVFLLPSRETGFEAVSYFANRYIQVNHVFEEEDQSRGHKNKKTFWMGDSRLKMSTVHSFKGWEVKHVVLFVPEYAPESTQALDSIVYTAITRPRENLIVLNANERYREFGETLPKHWDHQKTF